MKTLLLFLALLPGIAHAQAPTLNLSISRAPLLQGEPFAIFVSDPNVSSHPALTLTATLDGDSVSLLQPTSGLWAFSGTPYGSLATHTFAIGLFEGSTQVGSQSMNFTVEANPTFPQITSLTPNAGAVTGGTTVLIKGSNFTPGATVKINGTPVSSSYIDSGDLLAITPNFQGATGPVPVEVDLPILTTVDAPNAVLAEGFYASAGLAGGNLLPVAIVSNSSQSVSVGSSVSLNGASSYDPNGYGLNYEWEVFLSPKLSTIAVGSSLSDSAQPTFTPDVTGFYVLRLVVRESSTLLGSDPELAVVQAVAGRKPILMPGGLR